MRIEIRTTLELPEEERALGEYIEQQKQSHKIAQLLVRALRVYAYGDPDKSVNKQEAEHSEKLNSGISAEELAKATASVKQSLHDEVAYLVSVLNRLNDKVEGNHIQSMMEVGACKQMLHNNSVAQSSAPLLIEQLQAAMQMQGTVTQQTVVSTPKVEDKKPDIEKEEVVVELVEEKPKQTKVEKPVKEVEETHTTKPDDSDDSEEDLSEEEAAALAALFFKG